MVSVVLPQAVGHKLALTMTLLWVLSGVGVIEAEAVMLGQPISMVLPEVVGYKLTGKLGQLVTSTDVVLTITKVSDSTWVHTYACTHTHPSACTYTSMRAHLFFGCGTGGR